MKAKQAEAAIALIEQEWAQIKGRYDQAWADDEKATIALLMDQDTFFRRSAIRARRQMSLERRLRRQAMRIRDAQI